jgi:hypothetical protein
LRCVFLSIHLYRFVFYCVKKFENFSGKMSRHAEWDLECKIYIGKNIRALPIPLVKVLIGVRFAITLFSKKAKKIIVGILLPVRYKRRKNIAPVMVDST